MTSRCVHSWATYMIKGGCLDVYTAEQHMIKRLHLDVYTAERFIW